MMYKDYTLQQWLDANFDYPDGIWQSETEIPDDFSFAQDLVFTVKAFENADVTMKPYSNEQLRRGLWSLAGEMDYIGDYDWNPVTSNLELNDISWEVRKRCIQSFKQLNKKLFAKRCAPELSAYRATVSNNPLNSICFMWWDIFAIWGSIEKDSTNRVDAEFLDVMEYCLTIDHIAAQEGALHGLNHIPNHRKQVEEIIDKFLRSNPNLDKDLIEYAEVCKYGGNL